METNGRFLILKRTKHIKMRYFFVKDKVDQGDVEIQYFPELALFPVDRMWSDILTKPKSGRAFLEYRSILINFSLKDKEHEAIYKSSGSEKPESYASVKQGGVLYKPRYSPEEMKYNTHLLQSSSQKHVGLVLKR